MKRQVIVKEEDEVIHFACKHILHAYHRAIHDHGFFTIALSGGSSPLNIYRYWFSQNFASQFNWDKIYIFWADERPVSLDNRESNYFQAMQAGLSQVGKHIYPLYSPELGLDLSLQKARQNLLENLHYNCLDYVILGMGDDGHCASLFPSSPENLNDSHVWRDSSNDPYCDRYWVENKNSWRLSMTLAMINRSLHKIFYVFGEQKASRLAQVFQDKEASLSLPAHFVGSDENPSLWLCDRHAVKNLPDHLTSDQL